MQSNRLTQLKIKDDGIYSADLLSDFIELCGNVKMEIKKAEPMFSNAELLPIYQAYDALIALGKEFEKLQPVSAFVKQVNVHIAAYENFVSCRNALILFAAQNNKLTFSTQNEILAFAADARKMNEYAKLGNALKLAVDKNSSLNLLVLSLLEKADAAIPLSYTLRMRKQAVKNKIDLLISQSKALKALDPNYQIRKLVQSLSEEKFINEWTTDDKTPSASYVQLRGTMLARIQRYQAELVDAQALITQFEQLSAVTVKLISFAKNKPPVSPTASSAPINIPATQVNKSTIFTPVLLKAGKADISGSAPNISPTKS